MIDMNFDIDGVLADFDKEYFGKSAVEDRKFDDSRFKQFVEDKKFEYLDVISDGFVLMDRMSILPFVRINVLGSTASTKYGRDFGHEVIRQKMEWFKKVIPYNYDKIGYNFVENKSKKKYFATPTSILIDDSIENVRDFSERGGSSVLYNMNHNIDETYFKLKQIYEDIMEKGFLY